MKLWRINLKPGHNSGRDSCAFCIQRSIVGIGWGLEGELPASKEEYMRRAKDEHGTEKDWMKGWPTAAKALLYRMEEGHLVWTRNPKQNYYLGRVTSDWEPKNAEDYKEEDIRNVRDCEWVEVGPMDNVPGAVRNAFTRPATLQTVKDPNALEYSSWLYEKLLGHTLPCAKEKDILRLLSDSELEDVVGIYLQVKKKCVVIPSTCKRATPLVECLLISLENGERVGVQVKSGQQRANQDEYRNLSYKVYLFSACGQYEGDQNSNALCLDSQIIEKFIRENIARMPGTVQNWMSYIRGS